MIIANSISTDNTLKFVPFPQSQTCIDQDYWCIVAINLLDYFSLVCESAKTLDKKYRVNTALVSLACYFRNVGRMLNSGFLFSHFLSSGIWWYLTFTWVSQSWVMKRNGSTTMCMHPANGRRRYNVKSFLIGLAHTQSNPCNLQGRTWIWIPKIDPY